VQPRRHDLPVDRRDPLQGRLVLAGDHLDHLLQAVVGVAWVDPLGRIAEGEVDAGLEPGEGAQQGPADLLGDARIDRRLQHHHRAPPERRRDGAAGRLHMGEIGPAVGIDRRRHGDREEAGTRQVRGLGGEAEPGVPERRLGHLPACVMARDQRRHPPPVGVEAGHLVEPPGQGERQGQAHVAQTHDSNAFLARHPLRPSPPVVDPGPSRRRHGPSTGVLGIAAVPQPHKNGGFVILA
jgi:hypothetical protein